MAKKQQPASAAQNGAAHRPPIAVQVYTLRSLSQTPAELLAAIADAGYSGVELAGTFAPGMDPAELRGLLDEAGLQVVSAHISLAALEADLPGVISAQKTLGNDTIIVPWVAPDQRGQTADTWKALGARLAAIARRCAHAGMKFMYHNHDFEMVVIDGRPAIDWLLQGAADAGVPIGFEMDVAWAQHGGQDVPTLLDRYAGRVARLHAKDLAVDPAANPDEKGLADVGSGKLDWDAILPAAKAAGVEWYVVEHDFPSDPLASIRRSYAFLAGKLNAD
jgi:sugar phosphate isomerase/epimerase